MSEETSAFLSDKFMPARLPEVCAPRKALLARVGDAAQTDLCSYPRREAVAKR